MINYNSCSCYYCSCCCSFIGIIVSAVVAIGSSDLPYEIIADVEVSNPISVAIIVVFDAINEPIVVAVIVDSVTEPVVIVLVDRGLI